MDFPIRVGEVDPKACAAELIGLLTHELDAGYQRCGLVERGTNCRWSVAFAQEVADVHEQLARVVGAAVKLMDLLEQRRWIR